MRLGGAALIALALCFDIGDAAEILAPDKLRPCDVLIIGTIENGDENKFREVVSEGLKTECDFPRITIYSPGGSIAAAIAIGLDIQELFATTSAPEFFPKNDEPTKASRNCRLISQLAEEKVNHQLWKKRFEAEYQQTLKAYKEGRRPPPPLLPFGAFDPTTGDGDNRCVCASACFLIWMAGAERYGDAILVHRPYFDRSAFKRATLLDAKKAFDVLQEDTRKYLVRLGAPVSLIDRMFSIPSTKAEYLPISTIKTLRAAYYFEELKIAQCGVEPGLGPTLPGDENLRFGGLYKHLAPADRRQLIKEAEREICWRNAQGDFRRKVRAAFLAKYGK